MRKAMATSDQPIGGQVGPGSGQGNGEHGSGRSLLSDKVHYEVVKFMD